MKRSTSLDDTFVFRPTSIFRQLAKLRTLQLECSFSEDKLKGMRKKPKTTCEIWMRWHWKSFYGHLFLDLLVSQRWWLSSLNAFLLSCQKKWKKTIAIESFLVKPWKNVVVCITNCAYQFFSLSSSRWIIKKPDELSKDIETTGLF